MSIAKWLDGVADKCGSPQPLQTNQAQWKETTPRASPSSRSTNHWSSQVCFDNYAPPADEEGEGQQELVAEQPEQASATDGAEGEAPAEEVSGEGVLVRQYKEGQTHPW